MPRQHPDWLATYCAEFSSRGECPERFHYWVAVATIAGALRRRVFLDMKTYHWFPNMYVVLVGPPGLVKKSTAINTGSRLLRDVPNIHIGSDCTTWQQFVQEVAQAEDMFATGTPDIRQMTAEDAAEALGAQKHTVTCALTLTLSEWGTFIDPQDRFMINVLTELWDGKVDQPFVKATKTQGSDTLMNPFVNMIAGTTPDWIRDNFSGRFGGWGFSSRCIFLYADRPEQVIAYADEYWQDDAYNEIQQSLLTDLITMSKLQGPCTLSPSAREFGKSWYAAHMDRATAYQNYKHKDPWVSYYLARKWDHISKLAMIVSVSRRDSLVIEREDLVESCRRCDLIEDELHKVFSSRSQSDAETKRRDDCWAALASAIARSPALTLLRRDVDAFLISWMAGGRAKEFLSQLIEGAFLVQTQDAGKLYLSYGANAILPPPVKELLRERGLQWPPELDAQEPTTTLSSQDSLAAGLLHDEQPGYTH